jgi:hypothetical protein
MIAYLFGALCFGDGTYVWGSLYFYVSAAAGTIGCLLVTSLFK